MPTHITGEFEFLVGQEVVFEGPAPEGPFMAVFEDDGQTGYFYALDTSAQEKSIQDALQIYNVSNVTNRSMPVMVKIGWSQDNQKVVLLINDYPHAIFDFQTKQGFCRLGFPPPPSGSSWSHKGHEWNEAALELFV